MKTLELYKLMNKNWKGFRRKQSYLNIGSAPELVCRNRGRSLKSSARIIGVLAGIRAKPLRTCFESIAGTPSHSVCSFTYYTILCRSQWPRGLRHELSSVI
jgi:hypothetical protein